VALESEFSLVNYPSYLIHFAKEEYGGARDILMLPCEISARSKVAQGWIWRTKNTEDGLAGWPKNIIELLSTKKLRDYLSLVDGDVVEIRLGI